MSLLRTSDWVNILAFSFFLVLACRGRSLGRVRRAKITLIGAGGLTLSLFTALFLPCLIPEHAASVIRDWIPYLLLLMCYWQAGQFVTRADREFEARLQRLDRRVVAPLLHWCSQGLVGGWLLTYLEVAYLSCYLSMPLGLGVLYLFGEAREANYFWTVVLLATYPSYALLPYVQTRPPRTLEEKWIPPRPRDKMRAFNLWILRHASIHANTFPSAHVASTTACALVLLRLAPVWVGCMFLFVAFSIAVGAVAGRYHYFADAALAIIVASLVFAAATALVPERIAAPATGAFHPRGARRPVRHPYDAR